MKLMELLAKHGVSYDQFKLDPEQFAYDYLLKGKKKHFCSDWDFMAIDEHSPEFEACTCTFKD